MIKRQMAGWLGKMAKEYAVLSIMGPRQSGKTTLARSVFPNYGYVNLEDPDARRAAEADGADFLQKHPAPLILDEVQRVPELLSRIQVLVDANPRKKAAYVLTGSHQLGIREAAQVDRDPLFGGLFENMVIADVLKQRLNAGLEPDMYFVRDYKGFEVDLLVEDGRAVDLYEIKSSVSFQASFADNVARLAEIVPNVRRKTVVYSGVAARAQGVEFVNYAEV